MTDTITAPETTGRPVWLTLPFFREYAIIGAFVVLFVVLSFTSDVFLTQQNLLNLAGQQAPVAILAFAFTWLLINGEFDLSAGVAGRARRGDRRQPPRRGRDLVGVRDRHRRRHRVRGGQRRPRGVRAHQLVRVDVGDRHHLLRDPIGAHQRPAGHDHGRRLVRDPRSGRADRDQVVDLDHAARRPGGLVRAVAFEARTAGVRGRWQPGRGAPVGHRRQDDQVAVVHGGGPRRRNRRGDPHLTHHDRATRPGHDLRVRRLLGGRGGRHLDRWRPRRRVAHRARRVLPGDDHQRLQPARDQHLLPAGDQGTDHPARRRRRRHEHVAGSERIRSWRRSRSRPSSTRRRCGSPTNCWHPTTGCTPSPTTRSPSSMPPSPSPAATAPSSTWRCSGPTSSRCRRSTRWRSGSASS